MLRNSKSILGLLLITLCLDINCAVALAQEFADDIKDKRDPFVPLVTSDGRLLKLRENEGPKKLSLEGIIYDKQGVSYAIVNGQVVKIGDRLGDHQVLKIEKDKIIFVKEGEPLELELKKEEE
jgi:hypothetical protein